MSMFARIRMLACALILLTGSSLLSGCAVGIFALLGLAFSDSGSSEEIQLLSVSSADPLGSAVVGGVEVTVKGKNFDPTTRASIAGIDAETVFVDNNTLKVVVPFHRIGEVDIFDASTFESRYSDAGGNSHRLIVESDQRGSSSVAFWYHRPQLELPKPDYGHLGVPRTATLQGKYFGFNREDSNLRVFLQYQDGLTLREISEASIVPGDGDCPNEPCVNDPHQGKVIDVTMPTRREEFSDLLPGPNYRLRVTTENGIAEVDFGYAPPFPPILTECTLRHEPGPSVELRWREDAFDDPEFEDQPENIPFDTIIIMRDDDLLVILPGGIGAYVDTNPLGRVHTYRIVGQIGGNCSPAARCEISVVPDEISVDIVWDIQPSQLLRGVPRCPGFDAARALDDASGEDASGLIERDSAEKLFDAIVDNGRAPFLFRGTNLMASAAVRELIEEGRLSVLFISSGEGMSLADLDEESRLIIEEYFARSGTGGIYFEGQHLGAVLGASTELGVLAANRFGIDVKQGVQIFESARSVGDGQTSFTWSGGASGVAGYRREDERLEQFDEILDAESGSGEDSVSFVSSIASRQSRSTLSFLHVAGFESKEERRAIIAKHLERLLPVGAASRARSGDLAAEPKFAPVRRASVVRISGVEPATVSRVLFGSLPGTLIDATGKDLEVATPVVLAPQVVPLYIAMENGTISAGFFRFVPPQVEIHRLIPGVAAIKGGSIIEIHGADFTLVEDLIVQFGGARAVIREVSDAGDLIVCEAPRVNAAGAVEVVVRSRECVEETCRARATFTYVDVEDPVAAGIAPKYHDRFSFSFFPPVREDVVWPVESADLNGDGLSDFLFSSGSRDAPGKVRIFLNSSEQRLDSSDYSVGIEPLGLAVGYLDEGAVRDEASRLDIVTANAGSDSVSVLRNAGDGTFESVVEIRVGSRPLSVAVGDLDGDLDDDIVVANSQDGLVSVLLQEVEGNFGAPENYGTFAFLIEVPLAVAIADVNGDGRLDIVVAGIGVAEDVSSARGLLSVLPNRGDGRFGSPGVINGLDLEPRTIDTADFDGDGRIDLLTTGTMADTMTLFLGAGQAFRFNAIQFAGVGSFPTDAHFTDLDGDGRLDIVVASRGDLASGVDGAIHRFLRNEDGELRATETISAPGMVTGIALGDVNSDSGVDFLAAAADRPLVWLQSGDGASIREDTLEVGADIVGLVLQDIDDDGDQDLIAALRASSRLVTFVNDGKGRFSDPESMGLEFRPVLMRTLDVDGDRKSDLILAGDDGSISIFVSSNANGETTVISTGMNVLGIAAGDVNRDDHRDLIVWDDDPGRLQIYYGSGDGDFIDNETLNLGSRPQSATLADYSGDGLLDLVIGNVDPPSISLYINRAEGPRFELITTIKTETAYADLHAGDLDGDGDQDLVVVEVEKDGTWQVVYRNDEGIFTEASRQLVPGSPSGRAALIDLESDGDLDLVTPTSEGLSVLLNRCDGEFVLDAFYASDTPSEFIASGDFNADRRVDFVIAGSSRDAVALFISSTTP